MITTANLELLPHLPSHLLALIKSEPGYEEISGFKVADGVREFLVSSSPEFKATRVLEKCGFTKVSETVDPENGLAVWRWERPAG